MNREPMFNIAERSPVWLASSLVILYAATVLLPNEMVRVPLTASILMPLETSGRGVFEQVFSLLAHGFAHGSWSHVLMNSAMIVAFGVVTIRGAKLLSASQGRPAKGEMKFILIFLVGVCVGGMAQWLQWAIVSGSQVGALGASGGASALFATAAWAMGGKKKLLSFGVGWMFINLLLVVAEPIFGIAIAWAAHLGGYLAGAALAPLWVRAESTGFSITR